MAESKYTEGLRELGSWGREFYAQNKAHIFTGLGMAGTVATGILSARDGARAARKIDRRAKELGRPLRFGEKVRLCWKDYIDASAMCALACFSEFKSDQINTRTIADRTALLIASEKAYEKLSQKTQEVLGEKKAKQVKDEIAKEEIQKGNIITPQKLEGAPRVGNGTLYPYVDGYSYILFWSNPDFIDKTILELRALMKELAPRQREYEYSEKKVGVPYTEWLTRIQADPKQYSSPERRDAGWNKGYEADGSEDDPIGYSTTTMEYERGFAVTVINWDKKPTDMKLGRMLKSGVV